MKDICINKNLSMYVVYVDCPSAVVGFLPVQRRIRGVCPMGDGLVSN